MSFIHRIKQIMIMFFIIVFFILSSIILLMIVSIKQYNKIDAESLGHNYQLCTPFPAGPYYSYIMNGLECTIYDYTKVSTGVASYEQENRYNREFQLIKDWTKLKFPEIDRNSIKIQNIIINEGINQKSYIKLSRIFDSFSYKSMKTVRWFFYLIIENSEIRVLYVLLFIFSLSCVISILLKISPNDYYEEYEEYDDWQNEEEFLFEDTKENDSIIYTEREVCIKNSPIDSQGNKRII